MPNPKWAVFSQVRDIYNAYPRHRKNGPGSAHRAIALVLDTLHERGEPDPIQFLVERVRSYARSWAAQHEDGQYVPSIAHWMEEGRYDQDDRDWGDPKKEIERDRETWRAIRYWYAHPNDPSIARHVAALTPAQQNEKAADWIRLCGNPGPYTVGRKLRLA